MNPFYYCGSMHFLKSHLRGKSWQTMGFQGVVVAYQHSDSFKEKCHLFWNWEYHPGFFNFSTTIWFFFKNKLFSIYFYDCCVRICSCKNIHTYVSPVQIKKFQSVSLKPIKLAIPTHNEMRNYVDRLRIIQSCCITVHNSTKIY